MSRLLQVRNLKKHFPIGGGLFRDPTDFVKAVDGVSFDIEPGEVFGVVGESGCGKTTLARSLLRLIEPTGGSVSLNGDNILEWQGSDKKRIYRHMQIVFQDPYSSLHPRKLVKDIVSEGLVIHGLAERSEVRERVLDMLQRVGLNEEHLFRYPHEFSGGQRQRIALARALVLHPQLILLDEPTSALDVSVQSKILNLLVELKEEFGLTYLIISHDLSVMQYVCDRIGVMYLGKLVEVGQTEDLFAVPKHPYTKSLIDSIPSLDPRVRRERIILEGDVPSPINPPSGCSFRTRCPYADKHCTEVEPPLEAIRDRWVACHYPLEE
ncbi:MAG: Oligopeptide transport ATP-binding protein OppF [Anaerolineales bacterium]|nr:Oligopeptide transport ATP-binding protein OppF [Anaerolineales bacterium]